MTSDVASPRGPSPHTFIGLTLLALSAALFATWAFVLRPAADESAGISPDDLVSGDVTDADPPPDLVQMGLPAPEVTLTGLDGPDVSIESLRGKPAVINFWASSCAPCIQEMPLLERVHQQLGDEVTFVGVDVFESPDLGRQMVATTGVTYAQTIDPTNEVLTTYGGVQLPHTVVLRADGTVAALHTEALADEAELLALIDGAR